MLFYHGRGERDYATKPHPPARRVHWEFAAILAGHAAPSEALANAAAAKPALWVHPPRHRHGWYAPPGPSTEVCVLHLARCPGLIADAIPADGYLRLGLTAASIHRIRDLDQRLAALSEARSDSGEIAADLALGVLGELLLPTLPAREFRSDRDGEREVKRFLAWCDAEFASGAKVEDATRSLGISAAHLRRLCHRHAGRSPRALLQAARIERAKTLLREDDRALAAIAWDCGFASAVALSQAFLRATGQRPGTWRSQISEQ